MARNQPWRYADREVVRQLRARQFRNDAAASDDSHNLEGWRVSDDGPSEGTRRFLGESYARMQQAAPPPVTARPDPRKGGGGNPFGKALGGLKSLGGDIAGSVKEQGGDLLGGALQVLDAPRKYVGAPAFGVASGLTHAEVYTDPKTGQRYRKTAGLRDVGESLAAAFKDPVKAYKEGGQAAEEYFADPNKNFLHRGAGRAVTDPLSYVGPGLASRAVQAAGLSGTKLGRVGYELLESGGPGVVLGANVTGEAESEYGEKIPVWNRLSPEARVLVASVLGGVAGGVAQRRIGQRGLEAIPGAKQGFGSGIEDITADPRRAGNNSTVQSSADPSRNYEFRYRIVDLDDLTVSHDPYSFEPNARYEQEIQPRDRSSAASRTQVEQMARTLDPKKLLAETSDLQNGIPIIGRDGVVESGNGRTMATIRAHADYPERWDAYRNELQGRLMEYGIDPSVAGEIEKPFLVRERITDVDRPAFAAEANASSTLRMGTAETAAADARMISDELIHNLEIPETATLDNVLVSPRTAAFVRQFVQQLSPTERGAIMDASGNLTAQGIARLKAAFFAKTYQGPAGERLLAEFFESADPTVRNVRAALEQSLPAVARLEAGVRAGRIEGALSIADDVAAAADAFQKIKSGTLKFKTIDDYLNQASMFDNEMNLSPMARDILRFLNENTRAPKPIREALQHYAHDALATPPPGQATMFGDAPAANAQGIWQNATGRIVADDAAPPAQGGLALGRERPVFGGGNETVPPKAPNAPPRGVPTEVQRIDEPGTVSSVEKPQGLYTSPGDIESPHADLGGAVVKFRTNPNARVLVIDSPGPALRRGSTASGAGVAALRSLVGEAEFDRLRQLSNADLRTEAASEYPNVDWSRYSDKQEVLEGLGGQKARDAGYDAIWDPTDADARFHEYVALTQNAFLPEGQEIGSRGANVAADESAAAPDAARVESPESASPSTTSAPKTESGVTARPDPSSNEKSSETPNPNMDEQASSANSEFSSDASKGSKSGTDDSVPPRQERETPRAEDSGPPPPLDRADDWSILGLKKGGNYTEDDLRRAYRSQMRRYHPDLNPSPSATTDAKDINAAFERLMKGQGQTHGTSGARSSDDYREQARRQRRTRDEQQQANEEARQRRQQRENPPPGGGEPGPDPYDWWAAWGSKPPEWGEGPPPPPRGPKKPEPTFKHFGQDDRYDLFNAEARGAQVAAQEKYLKTLRGQVNQAFRKLVKKLGGEHYDRNLELDTVVRPFVVGEKNRVDNLINHWTAWFREEAETKLKRAGITVGKADDGAWRINGDAAMPTIEDVIERSTPAGRAFYDALSPEQRTAIEFLEWGNEAVNKTILAHGGKTFIDPDIEGTYFPRKVAGIDGQERTSGSSSFKKSRTMESLEEGIGRVGEGGKVEYTNPFDALEAGMRGKLRHAQDAYLRETLAPLAVKPDSAAGIRPNFGYSYVDHPALEGLLFKQDVADRITAALKPAGDNVFTRFPKSVNRVLTPLRATGDVSATFQQGMITWLRNPAKAAEHWIATVMSLKDPEVYFKAVDDLEAKGPGFNQHIRWGGHYVNPHSVDEYLMPKVARALTGGKYDSIPIGGKIAQKSNEHFARFLNLVRFDMANDAYKRAIDTGLSGGALDDHMRKAWASINRATGWSARKPSTIEQLTLFAPRYFSASVEQVYTALTKRGVEGSIARNHLIRLTAAGATVAWLWNEANGHETEWDPRSNNFLRLRDVAGMDVSVFGTYDTLFRAIAGTVAGRAGEGIAPDVKRPVKFAESKMSPAMKLLYEPFVARETYLGEPLDVSTPGGAAKAVWEQAKSSLPFNVQDLIEEGPTAGVVGSTGLSARLLTNAEKLERERDKVANDMFGKPYDELRGAEKSRVNETEGVSGIQQAKDKQDLRRGGDSAMRVKIRQEFQSRMEANARYLAQGEDDAGNPFSGNDYREAYHELQTYLAGQRDTLKDISGGDKVVDGWFDLYDKAKMANGQMDQEKLDALQAEYRAQHPGVDELVDQVIGIRDDETLRQYREAQKLAAKYYDIPAYAGMTLKDARKAGEILRLASGMVQTGEAPNTQRALAMLTSYDATGVSLARMALKRGSNPQRRQFRLANPLFGRFYTNSASVLG